MSSPIPFLDLKAINQRHRDALLQACERVIDSGWYVLGGEVSAFEAAFAQYCETPHCVGVANGLDALTLILLADGIGPGDEVLVPSNTYIATWLAVSAVGATPVPVEPDPLTYNIDPVAAAAAITSRTKAILAVHLYGQPADMQALAALAQAHGLRLYEDAAQGHGARCHGRRAGSLSDAAGFSFYPGKNLGALGDGGAVVTRDAALADRVRVLANYGSHIKYHNLVRGVNSRLDTLQAALLMTKLPSLDADNAHRHTVAQRYLDGLAACPLQLPHTPAWAESVWHVFVVSAPQRDALAAALKAADIGSLIHYPIPPHLQPAYADLGIPAGALPIAERMAQQVLSLPMGPTLSLQEVDRVIAAIRQHFGVGA
jgi:dTDP-4-amino-4,6-dideoxygalactose transaminase